jgi:hypothetical protein
MPRAIVNILPGANCKQGDIDTGLTYSIRRMTCPREGTHIPRARLTIVGGLRRASRNRLGSLAPCFSIPDNLLSTADRPQDTADAAYRSRPIQEFRPARLSVLVFPA